MCHERQRVIHGDRDPAEAQRLQPGQERGGLDRVVGVAGVEVVQVVARQAVTHRWNDADAQAVTIGADDQIAIYELFALYGHLIDAGEFDRLNSLSTHDFEYDGEALGLGSPQRPPWWKQLGHWV